MVTDVGKIIQTRSGESPQALSTNRKHIILSLFLTSIVAMGFALIYVSPGTNWGGDFAGYLLQANALLDRDTAREVTLNASLMDTSDFRVGPDAYPWGLPAILALITSLFGQSPFVLKCFGIAAIGLATFLSGLLARGYGLGAGAAVCVAGLVGLQPDISSFANEIVSEEVYFLSFTTAALIFAVLSIDYRVNSGLSAGNMLAAGFAAVLVSLSFFILSIGAITMAAIAAILVANVVASPHHNRRISIASTLVFVATCAMLVSTYFSLLPDGSLVHASYLKLDPNTLYRRLGDNLAALGGFVPMVILPEPVRYLAVLGVIALAVLGAFHHRMTGLLFATYLVGHFLLITIFPFHGGQRYLLPLLPVLAILSIAGAQSASMVIRSDTVKHLIHGRDFGRSTSLLLIAGLIVLETYVYVTRTTPAWVENGPYSRSAQEMFSFVRGHPTSIEPVAFFKPRVMRLLSGKRSVLIRKVDSMKKVNAIVLAREIKEALPFQLTEHEVTTTPGFVRKFSNDEFSFYVRSATGE